MSRGRQCDAVCSICDRRCLRRPDRLCGDCRQAAAQRRADYSAYSPSLGLTGGRWVGSGGIVRWSPDHEDATGRAS